MLSELLYYSLFLNYSYVFYADFYIVAVKRSN